MAEEPIADSAFIVISGHNPETGKRERISKVRAHITRRQFRRLRYRAEQPCQTEGDQVEAEQLSALPYAANQTSWLQNVVHPPIVSNELRNSLTERAYPLLDPTRFAAETTRRIHKFCGLGGGYGSVRSWQAARNWTPADMYPHLLSQVFDVHLREQVNSHLFLEDVVRWTINDPHFTSTKLLNASGWDDILESGELSQWTTRQRAITVRLLNNALSNVEARAKDMHVTVAALQSFLAFEFESDSNVDIQLLVGNNEDIGRLKTFYQSLLTQFFKLNDENWTLMIRGHYLISYTDRLRRIGREDTHHHERRYRSDKIPQPASQDNDPLPSAENCQFAFPADFSLFTFSQQPNVADEEEDEHHLNLVYAMLCNLYHLLSISATCNTAVPLSFSTYEYLFCLHRKLLPFIITPDQQEPHSNRAEPHHTIPVSDATERSNDDARYHRMIAPLRVSAFMLVSCLLHHDTNNSNPDDRPHHQSQSQYSESHQFLSNLASRLRTLLSSSSSSSSPTGSTNPKPATHTSSSSNPWAHFPGALVWCHAIGLRFADPRSCDRTWFLMQFLRVSHMWMLEKWEVASKSVEMVVTGLERIGRVVVLGEEEG